MPATASAPTLPEHRESLWRLAFSPIVWAAHFIVCYPMAAVWCAKFAGPAGALGPIRWIIGALTLAALLAIAWNGWDGWGRHRFRRPTEAPDDAALPHDADSAEDRHRFLGFATFLLASLSAIATAWVGAVALFFEDCRP